MRRHIGHDSRIMEGRAATKQDSNAAPSQSGPTGNINIALRQVLHSQRNATTNITQNAERTSEETNKIGSQVKASHKATSADMLERKPRIKGVVGQRATTNSIVSAG